MAEAKITDRELLKAVPGERLPDSKRDVVKTLLDAFLTKNPRTLMR